MNKQLANNIERLENSFWLYPFWWIVVWLSLDEYDVDVKSAVNRYYDEVERQADVQQVNKPFVMKQRANESHDALHNATVTIGSTKKSLPPIASFESRKLRVRTGSGYYTVRQEYEVRPTDTIVGYFVLDRQGFSHEDFRTVDPIPATEWDGFSGGQDFGGGGQEGSFKSEEPLNTSSELYNQVTSQDYVSPEVMDQDEIVTGELTNPLNSVIISEYE